MVKTIGEEIMKARILLLVAVLSSCSGCASIVCRSEKTVNVSSEPSGMRFEIVAATGRVITQGITPMNVTLKRGRGYFQAGDYTARFSGYGYEPIAVPVRQGFETGWYFGGNLIFGGVIGLLFVDPLTGAMWDIKNVHADLGPRSSSYAPPVSGATTDSPPRPQVSYRIKTDEKGEPVKDENGNFIFEPVK